MIKSIIIFGVLILCCMSKVKVFKPTWSGQGNGAKVMRVIGGYELRRLDPFLMLDYFKVKLPGGFPDHPHRGFEAVTHMIEGNYYHEDFRGYKGTIKAGDVQWMTAGKGIIHCAMPESYEQQSVGFQLWINLKSDLKMIPPNYQEYPADKIPVINKQEAVVKVVSGSWEGVKGPIIERTPSYYFDVTINAKGNFSIPIPPKWNTIIFVLKGKIIYQKEHLVGELNCCVLKTSQEDQEGGRFVLIGGYPLNQPIAQQGPFVMNTQQQLQQTFKDYQLGRNGFEGSNQWESKLQYLADGKKYEQL